MDIEWTTVAVRDLRRLAARERQQVISKVEQYAANPAALRNQVKRLANSEFLRLRVANYRVLFTVEVAVMVVERIRHRREAYD